MVWDDRNQTHFGVSWLIISVILEIWWLIAVICSAVNDDECGWDAIEGQGWFIIIVVLLIFFGQFSIGELVGFIEYQQGKGMEINLFPRWVIGAFQFIAFLYLVLNALAIADNVSKEDYKCETGQIMLTTVTVNCAYCIITFVFSLISLPESDVKIKNQNNSQYEEENKYLMGTKEKCDDTESEEEKQDTVKQQTQRKAIKRTKANNAIKS